LHILRKPCDRLLDEDLRVGGFQLPARGFEWFEKGVDPRGFGLVGGNDIGRNDGIVEGLSRGEDGLHSVKICLANRIKLVVVAACATDRHAHECQRSGGDDVIEGVLTCALALVLTVGAKSQKPGRDHGVARVRCVLVPGDLIANELIVRLIGIERFDDIITIAPAFRTVVIVFEAA